MSHTKKYIGGLFLFVALLFCLEASATAQIKTDPNRSPNRVPIVKANLHVTPKGGNCTVNFEVTNNGGTDSGAFQITLTMNADGSVVKTFSVDNLKPKETKTFTYATNLSGAYTIKVDSGNTVDETTKKDNVAKVDNSCIR